MLLIFTSCDPDWALNPRNRGYATEYRAKALKSPSTGREICFVNYRGERLLLESTRYMQGGSSITQEDLDTLIVYNGQTLREFLKEREK